LYAATGGEQWERKRGWMSAAPLSEWQGVIINSSGRVTHLVLFGISAELIALVVFL
jgi:hypothetical protein